MDNNQIIEKNKSYWNANADFWFGTTALPEYGVKFVTEDELHLFGDVYKKGENRNEITNQTAYFFVGRYL